MNKSIKNKMCTGSMTEGVKSLRVKESEIHSSNAGSDDCVPSLRPWSGSICCWEIIEKAMAVFVGFVMILPHYT